jgi:hypothetical protein
MAGDVWEDLPPKEGSSAWEDLAPKVAAKPAPMSLRGQIIDAVVPLLRPGGIGKKINSGIDKTATFAGETVNDAAAKVLPEKIAAGLGVAANVGVQAVPMILGGEWGKTAAPAMRSGAERLMQSALKPSAKSLRTGKAATAINTLLDEGVNVSKGGAEKLGGMIDDLNNTISGAIKNSGATVDKNAVASRIQDVVSRIERTNPTPQDAIADVEKVYNQFIANKILPDRIPVARAQEIKQGIYKIIGEKYGTLGSDWVEAQKALARGFKEEIATAVPTTQINALNAKEGELINALKLVEARAIDGNKNPIGLGWLNPKEIPFWLMDRSPVAKSVAARAMNAGQEQIPATAARVGVAGWETLSRDKERNR